MVRRQRLFEICLVIGGCLIAVLVAWTTPTTGDYWPGGQVLGDSNPAPAIAALAHGHLGAYLANQPLMGLVSLLLRVPAVLAAPATPGHPLLEYRLGVVLCLLSAPALVVWLSRLDGRRQWKAICALLCVLLLAGPGKIDAVRAGHPEEVLTAVLAVAAVIAAQRGRAVWAGLFLGLAFGTKPWAVLAALPVFLALPGDRWKAAAMAVGVGGLAEIAAIAQPSTFVGRARGLGAMHLVNPYSLWWQLSSDNARSAVPARMLPLGLSRSSGLFMATGAAAAVAVGWGVMRRAGRLSNPLALLAILWMVRALADPHPNDYYYVPFLIALAVWEVYSLQRIPVLAVAAAGLLWLTYQLPFYEPTWPNSFLILWTLGLGVYLTRWAFAPAISRPRFVHPVRRSFNWWPFPVDLRIDDA
jgi:hypothetical protein